MKVSTAAGTLGFVRAALGALAYLAPDRFATIGRLPGASTGDGRYVTRLFGARDVVIGIMTMKGSTRAEGLTVGAVCDLFDTLSAVLARRDGKDSSWVVSSACATAGFVVAGVALRKNVEP